MAGAFSDKLNYRKVSNKNRLFASSGGKDKDADMHNCDTSALKFCNEMPGEGYSNPISRAAAAANESAATVKPA